MPTVLCDCVAKTSACPKSGLIISECAQQDSLIGYGCTN
jgi:hypothetical protein